MHRAPTFPAVLPPEDEAVAIHLLKAMTRAQRDDRLVDVSDLASDIGVRRSDARRILSALHREGLVDVLRMRVTLAGFAIGSALADQRLTPLRSERPAASRAA